MSDFVFIPGESFNGAVARWADEVGGIERMIHLTAAAGVRYGHRQHAATADGDDIRALAAEMDVDAEELLARATPYAPGDWTNHRHPMTFGHVTVTSLLIEKRIRRFSPTGIAASPHHRALWDVRLLPACTVTGEILLDHCGGPDCRTTGWSATLGIDRCEHCMVDLSPLPAKTVPESTRATLAAFAGLFSHDRVAHDGAMTALPPDLAAIGADGVVDLLVRLVPMIDNRLPHDLRALLGSDPSELCDAVAGAWRALTGWPDAVGEVAVRHVAARTGRHNDGNGGRTMRFLTRRHQFGAPPAVAGLIADWRRSISVKGEEGKGLRDRTVSGADVATATGLDTSKVAEYRRAGVFRVHFAMDLDRPEARFDRAEIEGISRALADRTSVEGARAILGMSCHGVEQLAAMRLIELVEHPYLSVHYGGPQISTASIERLVAAVRATAGPPVLDPVTLRAAMKTVGGRVKPWGEAIHMLVAGQLPFSLSPDDVPATEAILVDAASVPILRSTIVPDRILATMSPFMSKADAGELLNLAPARATQLLAHIETGAGSHHKAVPLDLAARLARRHMSVVEIAARRGVHPLRAQVDAISAKVPFLGAGGFCRRTAEEVLFGDPARSLTAGREAAEPFPAFPKTRV